MPLLSTPREIRLLIKERRKTYREIEKLCREMERAARSNDNWSGSVEIAGLRGSIERRRKALEEAP